MTKTKECEEAFMDLKRQLIKLPTLSPPEPREPLTLFVAGLKSSISVILVSEREGEIKPNAKSNILSL